jgi:hypothetical protein
MAVSDGDPGLLVRPEVARRQINAEIPVPQPPGGGMTGTGISPGPGPTPPIPTSEPAAPPRPQRFHGTVTLDPARAGRDASKIADEVLTHLVGLLGSSAQVQGVRLNHVLFVRKVTPAML